MHYLNCACRSLPVETLHTILLGPVKYLLKELMDRLLPAEKSTIECRINAFNFSGLNGNVNGKAICRYLATQSLCICLIMHACIIHRYHNSLVGRDYKVWAQIGIFIVWPFLTIKEKSAWLSLAKVYGCKTFNTMHWFVDCNSYIAS